MLKKMLIVSLLIIFSFTLVFAAGSKDQMEQDNVLKSNVKFDLNSISTSNLRDAVLEEGFEGDWPPAGWTLESDTESNWEQNDGTDYGPGAVYEGTYAAMFNNYDYSSGNSGAMITPAFDLSSLTSPLVSFKWWNNDGTYNPATLEVLISTDGTTFTSLETIETIQSGADTWVEYSHALDADVVKVKLLAISDYGIKNTYVDDFAIEDAPTEPEIVINYTGWDAGLLGIGESLETGDVFEIRNVGAGSLQFTSVTDLSASGFSTNMDSATSVAVGDTLSFGFVFTPVNAGDESIDFVIESNGGMVTISLSGSAYDPSDYTIESFEEAVPPAGWEANILDEGGEYNWEQSDANASEGTFSAMFNCWSAPSDASAELISPTYDISGGRSNMLHFYYAHPTTSTGYTDTLYVMVSVDDGANWTQIDDILYQDLYWHAMSYDISAYVSTTFKLKFLAISDYGQSIYIDQVMIPNAVTNDPVIPNVFFSEYIEGSSSNKAMEIYNGCTETVDLADFVVYGNYNGNAWSEVYPFAEGTMLEVGDVYVMASDEADQAILDVADVTFAYADPWYMTAFNGDDVRALAYVSGTDTTIVDIIGRYDLVDPGAGWAVAGIDEATKDHTLVRKDAVAMGNPDWDASAGTNADDSEWIVYDQNDFGYIGWHIDQPITPAYISGMVTIDGFGDITMATVAAGDSMTYVMADGTYMLEVPAGTYEVTASMSGYSDATVTDVVVTAGATTENVDFALMVIEETLWPPVNLDYTISGNEVNLNWTAPTQYGWNSYYQGPASLTWATPERATYFDVTDFGFAYPMELSSISHGFYHHSSYPWGEDTTFKFKIYDADGSTLLYESDVLTALEQWNSTILDLDTPITVTDNFWVSVAVTNTETGFPSSLFSGAIENLHGYVGSPGEWGEAEYDWATEVYIMGSEERQVLSYNKPVQSKKVVASPTLRDAKRVDSVRIDEIVPNNETRDLVSFNIYRDGVMINDAPVMATSYVDEELAAGSYTYYATAVWNYGESGPSNEVTAVLAYGDVSGTVTDSDTGDPIEGAAVAAGAYGATTAADGTYTIADMLVGTYDVTCSAAGYEAADAVSAEVTDGGNTPVNFALVPVQGDIFFFDDFESGTDNWTLEETWGLTEEGANSPTHSLTESPNELYGNDLNIAATLATPWDLSGVFGATLSFWYQPDIETSFDFMYLEISSNGTDWIELAMYDEEGGAWQQEEISISGFVGPGFETVSIRFRFESDGAYQVAGMLIDDIQVVTSSVDTDPPFIIHAGPAFYEGTDEDFSSSVELADPSGVASAQVLYTVDDGEEMSVAATQGEGNTWNFTIPAQTAGCQVDYTIEATDASEASNTGNQGVYSYIAGYHFIYDDGIVDFYTVIEEGTGAAVKVVNPAGTLIDMTYALIRNYTDQSGQDNNNFMFHVWEDDGGLPGADMITPFEVVPEATYENTSPMTRIDLRSYATELADISSDFFFGLTVETGDPEGKVHCTISQPADWNQSYLFDGTIWGQLALDPGTDYHFRAVGSLESTAFATINGTVTYDGNAVVGAEVVAGTYSTTTDDTGAYELFVNPGTYTVTINAEGYGEFTEDVTVADGDVATVDAVLVANFWAPSNLTGTLNGTNVVLQWEAPAAPVEGEVLVEGFETWPPEGWTFTDADADGNQWDDGGALGLTAHTGTGLAYSASYDNTLGALTPDNWLISPAVVLGANTTVNYWVAAQDAAWAGEHYGVYISTTGTDPADFELLFEETMTSRSEPAKSVIRGSREQGTWYERSVDLSAYTGTAYIAFRHFDVTDMYFLDLDDVTIGGTTRDTRELSGFNIYQNGVVVETTNANTLFKVIPGVTEYAEFYVTATYTDPTGESEPTNTVIIDPDNDAPENVVPMVTALNGNYPNPFNPATKISFSLKEAGNVSIEIFNIKGQKVKTLVNENMEAAHHDIIWNGTDDKDKSVSSGIYFYKMNTKDYRSIKKMMLLK